MCNSVWWPQKGFSRCYLCNKSVPSDFLKHSAVVGSCPTPLTPRPPALPQHTHACILLWLISTCETVLKLKQSSHQPSFDPSPPCGGSKHLLQPQSGRLVCTVRTEEQIVLACSKMELVLHPRSPTLAWIRSLGEADFW